MDLINLEIISMIKTMQTILKHWYYLNAQTGSSLGSSSLQRLLLFCFIL
jgi:hypothetical protein